MIKNTVLSIIQEIERQCAIQNAEVSEILKKAKLSTHIIEDWKNFKVEPSIPALMQICNELGVELERLFCSDEPKLTHEQETLLNEWKNLSEKQKEALYKYIAAMRNAARN